MSNDANHRTDSPVELWKDLSRELWEVQLLGGASRVVTADELLAGVRRREFDEGTILRRHGAPTWMTLREARALEPTCRELGTPIVRPVQAVDNEPSAARDVVAPLVASDLARRPTVNALAVPPPPPPVVRPAPLHKPPPPQNRTAAAAPPPDVDPFPTLNTEELAVVRPKSVFGKVVAVASVALVSGCVFAAMSAKISQAPNHSATANLAAAAPRTSPVPSSPKALPTAAAPLPAASSAAPAPAAPAPTAPAAAPAHAESARPSTAATPVAVAPKAPSSPAHHAKPSTAAASPTAHASHHKPAKKSVVAVKAKTAESNKAPFKKAAASPSKHKPSGAHHHVTSDHASSRPAAGTHDRA